MLYLVFSVLLGFGINLNGETSEERFSPYIPSDTISWKLLSELEYIASDHKVYGEVYLPKFSKSIKKLDKKKVTVRGYLVPVDKLTWALSKSTYASCFFCGKAGPETVIGITWKKDPGKLVMDTNAYITGTFVVNGTDVDDWMYAIKDAEIISKK